MAKVAKEKILAALAQLDPSVNEHWTDDGLPVTKAVQAFANDPEIKRSDINEVAPTFTRESAAKKDAAPARKPEMVDEPEELLSDGSNAEGSGETKDEVDDLGVVSDDQAEAAFAEASARVERAKQAQAEANRAVADAIKARDKAQRDLEATHPPLTHAQNIKQFLRGEAETRARKMGAQGVYGASQIDMAMSSRRSRGWSRPKRGQTAEAVK